MNTVITIGRQFGSGGRAIGEMLAKKYGIKCYDKELIARVAKESGLSAETIEHQDERPTTSFLYNLVMDTHSDIVHLDLWICRLVIKYFLHSLIQ